MPEGKPYLVIAKQHSEDGTGSVSASAAKHFFTFATDEGQAILFVKELMNAWYMRELERDHERGHRQNQVAMPAHQFTVKLVVEYQSTPGSRVFAL